MHKPGPKEEKSGKYKRNIKRKGDNEGKWERMIKEAKGIEDSNILEDKRISRKGSDQQIGPEPSERPKTRRIDVTRFSN